jgi:two-component system sensor histidine kinase KdpD
MPVAPSRLRRFLGSTPVESLALLGVALALTEIFRSALTTANVALIYLTAVVVIGIRRGVRAAVACSAASLLLMSFFIATPRFSIRDERPEDWVTFLCFGIAALVSGNLAGRFRDQLQEVRELAERNERLYGASEAIAGASTLDSAVQVMLRVMSAAFEGETLLLLARPDGALHPAHPLRAPLSDADRAAAQTAYRELRWTGRGIPGSTASAWSFVPLEGDRRAVGVLGLLRPSGARALGADNARLLVALCHLAAVALDRHRLADDMRAAQVWTETEKLRAALGASVSRHCSSSCVKRFPC